jgi:hypothetical protein
VNERLNKTSICSIVFLDIVEYSQKSVADQISIKERFNSLISAAIQNVPKNDCIILDTGDGAGISLLGAPEEALFVSLTIRDGILKDNQDHADPLLVRIGINLGPVRVVKDINDRPNIIGDGINVAQRVMSFAEPNQILVSRSYYEVVSRLSSEMIDMFYYSGIKADKHVREHEIYSVGQPAGSAGNAPLATVVDRIEPVIAVTAHANTPTAKNSKIILIMLSAVILLLLAIGGFMALNMKKPIAESSTLPSPNPSAPQTSTPMKPSLPSETPALHVPEEQQPKSSEPSSKAIHQKKAKPREGVQNDVVEEVPAEDFGPGYLTKDASGQQVILYGDAAIEARARDKVKRSKD